jgi:hypothetical protein
MAITQYKLEKFGNEGMSTPPYITDGGYWYDPYDNSMLGWFVYETEFSKGEIKEISKLQIAERLLDMHSRAPFANSVNTQITLTNVEVEALADDFYTRMYTTNFVDKKDAESKDIIYVQEKSIAAAFREMEKALENATVSVFITSANTNCPFGCDSVTQENIVGINTALAVGIPVPNPTNWTPKGYPFPVEVTHAELTAIGGAILNKKNDLYTQYFIHKANIMMSSSYEEISKYDFYLGYK